ncbi:hypothetical protein KDK95_32220 [Actinospica sp. MGRD01-02]|uniref:Uncharacterized protein n=1 Tax=Actinospica acidithermotolerans TaxID=2828514 RepID=A0A941IJQ1_9ACTN|nr:hypothetical protein [Actinospica acidithermotolerans]MBR7831015.1 hypothetical protein [Actinospica acidithermotolerans]
MDGMLVSKSSIQGEFGSRQAEFLPPGEQLHGLFEAEYGETPFLNPTGNPIFLLLSTNFVLFVGAKRFSNNPTTVLGRVPRTAMRFLPPDNGVAHFRVSAQMQDDRGQWYQVRLKVHKMWREEATAFVTAVNASGQPQQPQAYPQQGQPQAYPQPYSPVQPHSPAPGPAPQQPQPYPQQPAPIPAPQHPPQQYPPYQQPYPQQSPQAPYPPRRGQGWS